MKQSDYYTENASNIAGIYSALLRIAKALEIANENKYGKEANK